MIIREFEKGIHYQIVDKISNTLRRLAFEGIVHDVKKADVPKKKAKETISKRIRKGLIRSIDSCVER
ncbi:hypothetical protein J2S13_000906 [Oikeobacillus pervagus]|uniref:Uncharacterized protein n=1 Tax=Oikeobacillus pervagus TaxID=1325931 RepID=A0AAJ1SXD7_9BACI|nr:hypothetical protein [Oikeobacillus pervagus]MDQ0214510.1 hypothetical protein [Oikeobacillus pervagus]